ncbi:MAG: ABC transporter permease subunit [Cellulomonas sp.]
MRAAPGTVTLGDLHDHRRSLVIWAVAVAAVSAMYTSFYPTINAGDWTSMLDSMPSGLMTAMGFDNLATAAGYVTSTVYSMIGLALVLVHGISRGSQLIAGDEEGGILELELTAPVTRTSTYVERLAALWLDLLAVVAAVTLTILVLVSALSLDISWGSVLVASALMWVTGGLFATLALAVGAATGRRGTALAVAAGVAVAAYVLRAIGNLTGAAWMTSVSPFDWFLGSDPLGTGGVSGSGIALLLGVTLACAVAGLVGLRRRDLMV